MAKKRSAPRFQEMPEVVEKTIRMALLEKWSNDHWVCGDKQPEIDAALEWLDKYVSKRSYDNG